MVLPIEERNLFFKNWLKLLTFVNNEYKIVSKFGAPKNPVGLDPNDLIQIRDKLWENKSIIDKYLNQARLKNEDKNIVSSWKNFRKGKFLLIKSLKKYSVLLDIEKEKLYGIYGISSPITDLLPYLPIMIETVLIPFNGKIIYDSLIERDNISFGKNMRQSFHEKYIEIKQKSGIINSLE
ncbi:MAG: hypothetical protein FWC97_00890 [Treponema sp.]|nr:hypothetical protein [Treponema sp.]